MQVLYTMSNYKNKLHNNRVLNLQNCISNIWWRCFTSPPVALIQLSSLLIDSQYLNLIEKL